MFGREILRCRCELMGQRMGGSSPKNGYCPFCSFKTLSASGVFIVPWRGVGPALESAAVLAMAAFLPWGSWVALIIRSSFF